MHDIERTDILFIFIMYDNDKSKRDTFFDILQDCKKFIILAQYLNYFISFVKIQTFNKSRHVLKMIFHKLLELMIGYLPYFNESLYITRMIRGNLLLHSLFGYVIKFFLWLRIMVVYFLNFFLWIWFDLLASILFCFLPLVFYFRVLLDGAIQFSSLLIFLLFFHDFFLFHIYLDILFFVIFRFRSHEPDISWRH